MMNPRTMLRWSPLLFVMTLCTTAAAEYSAPSWVFQRGTYTNDPYTGARVAQYEPLPAVEPLADPRLVTSRYRRSRTTIRGIDGSVDSTYEVQNFGNGRGGLDAEWERFHDAWRQSLLTGSYFFQNQRPPYDQAYGYPDNSYGRPDYGRPGFGRQNYGGPGYGGPGYGGSGYGGEGYGRPVYPHGPPE